MVPPPGLRPGPARDRLDPRLTLPPLTPKPGSAPDHAVKGSTSHAAYTKFHYILNAIQSRCKNEKYIGIQYTGI